MSSATGVYEYWQTGADGKWRFSKVAGNHEIEITSGKQGFTTKGGCIAAIGRDMEDSSHYEIVERVIAPGLGS